MNSRISGLVLVLVLCVSVLAGFYFDAFSPTGATSFSLSGADSWSYGGGVFAAMGAILLSTDAVSYSSASYSSGSCFIRLGAMTGAAVETFSFADPFVTIGTISIPPFSTGDITVPITLSSTPFSPIPATGGVVTATLTSAGAVTWIASSTCTLVPIVPVETSDGSRRQVNVIATDWEPVVSCAPNEPVVVSLNNIEWMPGGVQNRRDNAVVRVYDEFDQLVGKWTVMLPPEGDLLFTIPQSEFWSMKDSVRVVIQTGVYSEWGQEYVVHKEISQQCAPVVPALAAPVFLDAGLVVGLNESCPLCTKFGGLTNRTVEVVDTACYDFEILEGLVPLYYCSKSYGSYVDYYASFDESCDGNEKAFSPDHKLGYIVPTDVPDWFDSSFAEFSALYQCEAAIKPPKVDHPFPGRLPGPSRISTFLSSTACSELDSEDDGGSAVLLGYVPKSLGDLSGVLSSFNQCRDPGYRKDPSGLTTSLGSWEGYSGYGFGVPCSDGMKINDVSFFADERLLRSLVYGEPCDGGFCVGSGACGVIEPAQLCVPKSLSELNSPGNESCCVLDVDLNLTSTTGELRNDTLCCNAQGLHVSLSNETNSSCCGLLNVSDVSPAVIDVAEAELPSGATLGELWGRLFGADLPCCREVDSFDGVEPILSNESVCCNNGTFMQGMPFACAGPASCWHSDEYLEDVNICMQNYCVCDLGVPTRSRPAPDLLFGLGYTPVVGPPCGFSVPDASTGGVISDGVFYDPVIGGITPLESITRCTFVPVDICEPGVVKSCGLSDVGVCEFGVSTCSDTRVWGPCVGVVDPVGEVCDLLDNDCDGLVDEDIVCDCKDGETVACGPDMSSLSPVSECRLGERVCVGGKFGVCEDAIFPEPESAAAGTCSDGLDNDCDGLIDCSDPSCASCPVCPTSEVCDSIDNDCDLLIDEDISGLPLACVCDDADGDLSSTCDGDCDDSDSSVFAGAVELCDLKDNDCDGVVDESCSPAIVELSGDPLVFSPGLQVPCLFDGSGCCYGDGLMPVAVKTIEKFANVVPEGFELLHEPVELACRGQRVDMSLSIPVASDVGVTVCEGEVCRVVKSAVDEGLVCAGFPVEKLVEIERSGLLFEVPFEVEKESRVIESAPVVLEQDDKVLGVVVANSNVPVDLSVRTASGLRVPPRGMIILGALKVQVKSELDSLPLSVSVPFLSRGVDVPSLQLYQYVRGSWKVLGGSVDSVNGVVSWSTDDVLPLLDRYNEIVVGLIGLQCDSCNALDLTRVKQDDSDVDVVLVHGFGSNRYRGWNAFVRESEGNLWVVDYPSSLGLETLARELADRLEAVKDDLHDTALVGHSLGGLLVQRALQIGYDSGMGFVEKVRSVVLVGSPNEGSPIGDYAAEFSSAVLEDGVAPIFSLNSPLLWEIKSGRRIPPVPGISYYVQAGSRPLLGYFSELLFGDVPNDGVVAVDSASTVGGIPFVNACDEIILLNEDHRSLKNSETARRALSFLIDKGVDSDMSNHVFGRFTIDNCNTDSVVYIYGKRLPSTAAPIPVPCGCGNGVCGLNEDSVNCSADCGVIIVTDWCLIWLIVLIIVGSVLVGSSGYSYYMKRQKEKVPSWLKALVDILVVLFLVVLVVVLLCYGISF